MQEQSGILRIHGNGEVPVSTISGFLNALETSYNGILLFTISIERIEKYRYDFPRYYWPLGYPAISRNGTRLGAITREPDELRILVSHKDRLYLKGVRLESPGFWDFLGKCNPLEVLRQYLNDRHERKKDKDYRNDAERERLGLENEILRNKAIAERIAIARELGITDRDLAPLINGLLVRPLEKLEPFQDKGVINHAEEIDEDRDK